MCLHYAVEQLIDGFSIGDIGGSCLRLPTLVAQCIHAAFNRFGFTIIDEHSRTFRAQPLGDCASDTACRARDKRDVIVQRSVHGNDS
jgi:hypothetical protein